MEEKKSVCKHNGVIFLRELEGANGSNLAHCEREEEERVEFCEKKEKQKARNLLKEVENVDIVFAMVTTW